jgi:hypothetical protein
MSAYSDNHGDFIGEFGFMDMEYSFELINSKTITMQNK